MSEDQRARARSRRKRGRGRGPKRGDQPASGAPPAEAAPAKARDKRGRKRSGRDGTAKVRRPQREQAPGRTDQAGFWGDGALLPELQRDVRITDAPAAVPRSLGPPPLPGHEVVAEHYFRVVYERAVGIGGALAAAGGLIDLDRVVDDD
ncbi:MAG: hypothetical protein ACLFV0_07125 [Nitriliruptoraceae bacterium]